MPRYAVAIYASMIVWNLAIPSRNYAINYGADAAILVEASTSAAPPRIELKWPMRSDVASYTVTRRTPAGSESTFTLSGVGTGYLDTDVATGMGYEYRILAIRTAGNMPAKAYANIFSAIDLPMVEDRGRAILVVDNRVESPLEVELSQWEQDVQATGWRTERISVAPGTSIETLRTNIRTRAAAWPANTEGTVFLVGSLPIAYSGLIYPDGHADHRGAWPTDGYLANPDGVWTDAVINNVAAAREENRNIIGDGKFDQSTLPAPARLMVGRLDLSRLPSFAMSETELLRRYLQRNHLFRSGALAVGRRAVIDDNFSEQLTDGPAAASRFGMVAALGAAQVHDGDFLADTFAQPALMGLAAGAGTYTAASGAVSIVDCVNAPPKVVFALMFGSYFGDFDTTDNVLRAMLAADGCTLATAWSGRPQWQMHHLAMGYPLGYAARLTQNSASPSPYYMGFFSNSVHLNLLGDPTLQLFPCAPPTSARVNSGMVSWTSIADTARLGFHVYKRQNANDPWIRQTTDLVAGPWWTDTSWNSACEYLVKSVRRETTASGTFINASQGRRAVTQLDAVHIEAIQSVGREYPAQSAILRLSRSSAGGPLGLQLAAPTGTATEGLDFPPLPRNVTLEAGQAYVEIALPIHSDSTPESAENMILSLVPSSEYTIVPNCGTCEVGLEDHPYDAWCSGHFGTLTFLPSMAPGADPDGDGMANLLEYASGSHPLQPSSLVLSPMVKQHGNAYACRYQRRASLLGISWVCETSCDLQTWNPDPVTVEETIITTVNGVETVEVSMPHQGPQCFLRMRVVAGPGFFP